MAYEHAHEADEVHHHHHDETDSGRGMGWIVGLIVLVVALWLLFMYGLPAIRTATTPQISVPERVDVNVNTPGQGGGNQ
jgi:hypothetical protein